MKKRVLVVEDDPVLTRVLRDNLTFEGFEVESVADGAEAQAVAHQFAPDLVLLDVNLPGRSGFDRLRIRLRDQFEPGGDDRRSERSGARAHS